MTNRDETPGLSSSSLPIDNEPSVNKGEVNNTLQSSPSHPNKRRHIGRKQLLLTLILILLIACFAFYLFGEHRGPYTSKDFSVSFDGGEDSNFQWKYYIHVFYGDDLNPNVPCGALIKGFHGSYNIKYSNPNLANIKLTQNAEQPHKDDSGGDYACTDDLGPSYSKTIALNKNWLQAGGSNKTILINNQKHELTVNKSRNVISFNSGKNGYIFNVPYAPNGLAELYAYPMYSNCMSNSQLQDYARQHNVGLADSKYPGLTASLESIKHVQFEAPDGSKNLILVMANNYVEKLMNAGNDQGLNNSSSCYVVAGLPLATQVSP